MQYISCGFQCLSSAKCDQSPYSEPPYIATAALNSKRLIVLSTRLPGTLVPICLDVGNFLNLLVKNAILSIWVYLHNLPRKNLLIISY